MKRAILGDLWTSETAVGSGEQTDGVGVFGSAEIEDGPRMEDGALEVEDDAIGEAGGTVGVVAGASWLGFSHALLTGAS